MKNHKRLVLVQPMKMRMLVFYVGKVVQNIIEAYVYTSTNGVELSIRTSHESLSPTAPVPVHCYSHSCHMDPS